MGSEDVSEEGEIRERLSGLDRTVESGSSAESGPTPSRSAPASFPEAAIVVTILGFIAGCFLTPFKGELGLVFAATFAFICWLVFAIWPRRGSSEEPGD